MSKYFLLIFIGKKGHHLSQLQYSLEMIKYTLSAASSYAKIASFNGRNSWKNRNSYNYVETS